MYHKHRNNKLPTYIQNWPLQANKEIHHHNTRHADELHPHRALHMFAEKCLRYNVIRVVNNSPLCILDKLNTHSLTGFANYAKQIFIQKYQDKCIIQNCYTCLSRNNANTNRYTFRINLHVSETPTIHCFKHATKYGYKYIDTHTYMYKYIETHNIHIMMAHKCINSCTRMDYHIF